MIEYVHTILVILALVCFLFAAMGVITPRATNLTAVGLFLWLLATQLGGR